MRVIYVNGQFLPEDEAVISIEDRAHQFADGIYEVVAFFNRHLLDAMPHLERLQRSCDALSMPNPHRHDEWLELIEAIIARNGWEHGGVYLQLSRGTQLRSHVYQPELQPNVTLSCFGQKTPGKALVEQGASLITYPDLRWKRCDIKTTGLLANVMARQAAADAGANEALLVNDDNIVTEASIANFFMVKDGALFTHPSTHDILSGVARAVTIALAKRAGITVKEQRFTKEEMFTADEALLTGTTTNILPIVKVDDTMIGTGKPGGVTLQLLEGFIDHIKAQTGYVLWS